MNAGHAQTRCFKVSGGGNDFVAVLDREALEPDTVRALCARGLSLGADGAFALTKLDAPGRVRMDYFNGDGTPADLCVNGTRCAAQLAFHLGWAQDEVAIETGAGEISARGAGANRISLELAPPEGPAEERTVEDADQRGWFIETGVPHFVIDWFESLIDAPVWEQGPVLRHASAFAPAGTNVDYVRFVGFDRIEVRSYERGVEAETLACGTGVLAAAAVGIQLGRTKLPVTALTSGGFEMTVSGTVSKDRVIEAWSLTGDARILSEGTLLPGSLEIPEPPLWSP